MMYKATLTFSLLFLAVGSFAQNGTRGADPSVQPPTNFSSSTGSQVYPSGIPTPTAPTPSDGYSSQTNRTRPSGCYPHSATGIPTDQPLSSGVYNSSAAYSASTGVSSCVPNSEYTAIPTGTAGVPPYYGGGALPSANASIPIYSMTPTGSYDGNSTFPTGSSVPVSGGSDDSDGQQDPPANTPTATVSYVGRRMLVRRQY